VSINRRTSQNPSSQTILFRILSFIISIAVVCCFPSLGTTNAFAQDSAQFSDTAMVSPGDVSIMPYLRPALGMTFRDNPNDGGGALEISWIVSPDDTIGSAVTGYEVFRATSPTGEFTKLGEAVRGATSIVDNQTVDGIEYYYRIDCIAATIDDQGKQTVHATPAAVIGPAASSAQWFNKNRTIALVLILLVSGAILYFIQKAKSGAPIYVRKIAGIDAVEEAIGRATEMGKKVFFVPGIQDMNDVQTIAGIAILGRVAQVAAECETWLEVPVSKSLVMVTARETMKEAYSRAGRPDSFKEAQVHFITDEQFAYAAAVDGMIVREKPAAIFYMGAFFAESLILSETGNASGAIQIAGTGEPTQLPFFVAACDYTLLGEELFAASAYLSREPRQLGSLKGQDMGKILFLTAIIVGIILATFFNYNISYIFRVQ